MNTRVIRGWSGTTVAALLLAWTQAASGQTFSSGSTGADGPLNLPAGQPLTVTVRPGGVYNYTTVTIGVNSTLNFVRGADNSPVVILATGDVDIQSGGVITVSGSNGQGITSNLAVGGAGGPGGFAGGNGGVSPNASAGAAGQGPGGGFPAPAQPGTYGAPDSFVSLIPLFGGSGGAGGQGDSGVPSGEAGGGGGGAILIASSTRINIAGIVRANGGNSGGAASLCGSRSAAAASGGAIRLVAPQITGTGQLRAIGGTACTTAPAGGSGRIRLEASTFGFSGSAVPVPSTSLVPGPVAAAGNPALVNVPTLNIDSIGGMALPTTTGASYFVPDMTLPLGTTNPVPVALSAANTPVGSPTTMTVRLIPQGGSPTNVVVANHTGSFATSSGSADVTLPVGRVSVIQAFASMTLTGQMASLFPLIDGEPVERVMVAASPGQPSTLSLVTKSGKEVRVDELRDQDRVRVALAWEVLRAAGTE